MSGGYRNEPRKKLLSLLPKNGVCAEIGVWRGEFSGFIIKHTTPEKLYLIDPWKFQPKMGGTWYGGQLAKSQKDMDAIYNIVCERFSNNDNIVIDRDYSENAVKNFDDEYFDWIYIDGDHTYKGVIKDLTLYYPKIKKNGFITGDDFDLTDVRKAVRYFCEKYNKNFESIGKTQFLIRL